jgi:hypothetical protein
MSLETLTVKPGWTTNVKPALKELSLMLLEFAKMLTLSVIPGTPLMDYASAAMLDTTEWPENVKELLSLDLLT